MNATEHDEAQMRERIINLISRLGMNSYEKAIVSAN